MSVRVRMFLCVCVFVSVNVCTKVDLGREEDMLLCVCVYMFKEALPPTPPSKDRLLRTKLLSTLFF